MTGFDFASGWCNLVESNDAGPVGRRLFSKTSNSSPENCEVSLPPSHFCYEKMKTISVLV